MGGHNNATTHWGLALAGPANRRRASTSSLSTPTTSVQQEPSRPLPDPLRLHFTAVHDTPRPWSRAISSTDCFFERVARANAEKGRAPPVKVVRSRRLTLWGGTPERCTDFRGSSVCQVLLRETPTSDSVNLAGVFEKGA